MALISLSEYNALRDDLAEAEQALVELRDKSGIELWDLDAKVATVSTALAKTISCLQLIALKLR